MAFPIDYDTICRPAHSFDLNQMDDPVNPGGQNTTIKKLALDAFALQKATIASKDETSLASFR